MRRCCCPSPPCVAAAATPSGLQEPPVDDLAAPGHLHRVHLYHGRLRFCARAHRGLIAHARLRSSLSHAREQPATAPIGGSGRGDTGSMVAGAGSGHPGRHSNVEILIFCGSKQFLVLHSNVETDKSVRRRSRGMYAVRVHSGSLDNGSELPSPTTIQTKCAKIQCEK